MLAGIAAGAFRAAWGLIHLGRYASSPLRDTPIYADYAARMLSGHLPYRGFAVEYPPLARPAFLVPALIAGTTNVAGHERAFELLMAACAAGASATAVFVRAPDARCGAADAGRAAAALAPLLLGSVMLSRYDAWPALLTILAVAATVFGRQRAGFAVLALAVGAKRYPLAVLPVLLVHVWSSAGRRRALASLSVFAAVLIPILLPFAILAPTGFWPACATTRADRYGWKASAPPCCSWHPR